MKKIYGLLMVTIMAISFTSCVKEGPIGPAGPQGERGPAGDKGDKGDKGNTGQGVQVSEFVFENVTVAAGITYARLEIPVSKEDFEASFMLIYGQRGSNWLMIPGVGSGNTNTYRFYTTHSSDNTTTYVYIQRAEGPGPETFQKIRILVIPI